MACGATPAAEGPVRLAFCVSSNGDSPQLRILVPSSMSPYWPSPVTLNAALLGRPSLGNQPFVEMTRNTDDRSSVVYEFVDPKDKNALSLGNFTDAASGLAFSVAYGTCFLVPVPQMARDALNDNPFCLDTTLGPLAGALQNETRSFAEAVRAIPAAKTLSWLFYALMPTDLVPSAREASELRRLVSTSLPPILARLGVENVCARRADNPGAGWITTPADFEAECTKLAAEIRNGTHANHVDNVVTHITRRISLLVHIRYILTALPGREKTHCWPAPVTGDSSGEQEAPALPRPRVTPNIHSRDGIRRRSPPPKIEASPPMTRKILGAAEAQERMSTVRALLLQG